VEACPVDTVHVDVVQTEGRTVKLSVGWTEATILQVAATARLTRLRADTVADLRSVVVDMNA
jgi:hypothetical protein